MEQWLVPGGVVAVLALGGLIWKAGRWTGKVDNDLGAIKDFMEEIRGDIKKIFAKIGPPLVASDSPLRLTELRQQVAECLGAHAWAARVAPGLLPRIKGFKPFQIDGFADTEVAAHQSEWEEKIAECAFKFGLRRADLPPVLGIALRDELLRQTGQDLDD